MNHALGVMSQLPDPLDRASMRQLIEDQALLMRSLPDSKEFFVATYVGDAPTVQSIVGTRPKIFALLSVEGHDEDPKYALVGADLSSQCSNDPRLLQAALAHQQTIAEIKTEMTRAS